MNIDDVGKLNDQELLLAYWSMLDAEQKRDEAAKNPKFEKMEFPPVNPEFVKLKNKIKTELDNRQLKAEKNASPSS
jgi:hypothetical protein